MFLSNLKALEVFHRCLTPSFSLYWSKLGLCVLGCYPQVYILPFYARTCLKQGFRWPFQKSSKQTTTTGGLLCFAVPEALDSCLIILFPFWSINELFLVSGSQEDLEIIPICATSPLNTLSKLPKNLPKTTPTTDVFVHLEVSGGVPQVLHTSLFIVWIVLRGVGFRMLSAGQHLAVWRPNLSITRPQPLQKMSWQTATASGLFCFAAPEALDSCLTILFPF